MEEKLTLEQAMEQLAELVKILEDEQLPLDKALELFEKGVKLSKFCHQRLEEAEQKIKILTTDKDNNTTIRDWKDDDNEQ